MMQQTILGIFNDRSDAEDAINRLRDDGFNPKDISIVMKDNREAQDMGNDTGTNVAGGAVTGAATGAAVGGIAGLLAGTVMPGLAGFLIGGPIGAALGLTGAAATTVSGAATGAVAGGLIGALMGFGLTNDEAKHYESRINEGAILLAVPAALGEEQRVTDIFNQCNASDLQTVRADREQIQPTGTKRTYADRNDVNQDDSNRDVKEDEHTSHHAHHQHSHQYVAGAKGGSSTRPSYSDGKLVSPVQVEKYLKGIEYPCSKGQLIKEAENNGADKNVLHTLSEMPGDNYDSPMDISRAIGKIE